MRLYRRSGDGTTPPVRTWSSLLSPRSYQPRRSNRSPGRWLSNTRKAGSTIRRSSESPCLPQHLLREVRDGSGCEGGLLLPAQEKPVLRQSLVPDLSARGLGRRSRVSDLRVLFPRDDSDSQGFSGHRLSPLLHNSFGFLPEIFHELLWRLEPGFVACALSNPGTLRLYRSCKVKE